MTSLRISNTNQQLANIPVARYAVRIEGWQPALTASTFMIQLHDPEKIAAQIPYTMPAPVPDGIVSAIPANQESCLVPSTYTSCNKYTDHDLVQTT